MIKYLEDQTLPDDKTKAKEIVLARDSYFIEDSILYDLLDTKVTNPKRQIDEIDACLVVPEELKFDIRTSVHGDLNSGHYGTHRTYSTLCLKYY